MGWAQLGGPHKLELLGKNSRTAVHFFLVFDIKLFIDIYKHGGLNIAASPLFDLIYVVSCFWALSKVAQ